MRGGSPGRILYVQYTNPAGYPPLQHSSRLLAKEGWKVRFLGTGALGTESLRFPEHPRIEVRQIPFQGAGWRQKLHYLRYVAWVLWHTRRWRPHWIYASDLMACPIALAATRLLGTPVIYHEHDSPVEGDSTKFTRLLLGARRALARTARLSILPNAERARLFADRQGAQKVELVWNCPSLDEVEPRPRAPLGGELTVLYHGSIVPERLPETVVEALAQLPDGVRLKVVGYETNSSRGYSERLMRKAQALGVGRRIAFPGTVERSAMMDLCRSCDVGLALLPKRADDFNLEMMVGASNKPFDYLACGLALVVSDLPAWRTVYVDGGYGRACDATSAESIAEQIRWYWEHPVELRAMGERGRQRILAEWNYETAFARVADLLARV
ncbi:MAG: glycosyltransferase [Bryobacteraceae bacterium]|nr:glycosyltransferase [Bryobacteraceae bacterium]